MTNLLLTKLSNFGSSSVNCNIFIGNISGYFGSNCDLEILNSCLSNQTLINALLLESFVTILNTMTDDNLKNYIKGYLGITDITNIATSQFQQDCNALALINNDISIIQLNFKKCEATVPITLQFVNTGEALSTCGVSAILNSFLSFEDNNSLSDSTKTDFSFFVYLIIGLSILCCIIIFFLHFKNKPTYIYNIDHYHREEPRFKNILTKLQDIIKK